MTSAMFGLLGLGGSELILLMISFAALAYIIVRTAKRTQPKQAQPPTNNNR